MARRWPPWWVRQRHWVHLATLVVVATLVNAAFQASAILSADPAPPLAGAIGLVLAGLPPLMYVLLPAIAGVAAGLIRPARLARRRGVEIVLVVCLAMVVLDAVPGTVAPAAGGEPAISPSGELIARPRQPTFAETGMLRTLLAALAGDLDGASEPADAYPPGHPRATAARAVLKAGLLLAPAIVVFMVLGVNTWIGARVTFRSPLDERIHRLAVAWLLAPLAYWALFSLSESARFSVLFQGQALLFILWPHVLLGVMAAMGWERAGHGGAAVYVKPLEDTEPDPEWLGRR